MLDFRHRKIRRLFIGIVISVLAGMLLTSSYALHLIHRQKIRSGLDLAAVHARVFEGYLTQSFNNIDLPLRNAPAIWQSGQPASSVFVQALHNAPLLRSLSLVNPQGIVLASSNPQNIGKTVELSSFLPEAGLPESTLHLGTPWQGSDLNDGIPAMPPPGAQAFLPIIRNITLDNENFRLLASVKTDYFIQYFRQMTPPKSGFVEAVRLDGIRLFSTRPGQDSGNMTGMPAQTGQDQTRHGTLRQRIGGREYLTGYQHSSTFPFLVHVHLDKDVLLAEWQNQLRLLLSVIGLAALAFLGLSVFIYRRLLYSAKIQRIADEQLKLAAQVFKSSAEAIFIATTEQRIFSVNRAFSEITGYPASEIIGKPPSTLCADHGGQDACPWEEIGKNRPWVGEISLRRKSGEIYPGYMTISCAQNETGQTTHYIGMFSDITERKMGERLRYLSEHDYLTGLPNRRLLEEHIDEAITRIERYGGRVAILFLDLDHFKEVNDSLGHHVGDLLLKEVAARMRTCIRATDLLCRQGGDEFMLLIDVTDAQANAAHVAQKLIEAIGHPFELAGSSIHVTPSIGIALCPDNGRENALLLQKADRAMYYAKKHGRNHFEFYRPDMENPDPQ